MFFLKIQLHFYLGVVYSLEAQFLSDESDSGVCNQ